MVTRDRTCTLRSLLSQYRNLCWQITITSSRSNQVSINGKYKGSSMRMKKSRIMAIIVLTTTIISSNIKKSNNNNL